jgi:ferredoxin-NADP reductase
VVHIVSGRLDDPRMLLGRLDARVLQAICGNFSGKAFFICCPPPMMASLISGLRRAGVDLRKIHADYFGL